MKPNAVDQSEQGLGTAHFLGTRSRLLLWLSLGLSVSAAFVLGIAVGHYRIPPFGTIHSAKAVVSAWVRGDTEQSGSRGEQEIMEIAFVDPVSDTALYYPPVNSLAELRAANERILMRREGFEAAYEDLELIDATQLERAPSLQPVIRVRFRYQKREYEAFAYGRLPQGCPVAGWASLIIPGSLLNQSFAIATNDPSNYHFGILDGIAPLQGAAYVLVKPNEDFRAWHNGDGKKLSGNFIWNWHLNRGGSYSVSYLVEGLAIAKWMKGCFDRTLVAGLSQGGAAAMLNALQSQPDRAIVAAGYSVLSGDAEWSGHNQLIAVPGYARLHDPQGLLGALQDSPTQWLFTYGKSETGIYRIEAYDGPTKRLLEHLERVNVVVHPGEHVFPVQEIANWLSRPIDSAKDQ